MAEKGPEDTAMKLTPAIVIKRILAYCLGLFIMALGVSLSVLSDLGVSPMSSIPYVLSQIVPAISQFESSCSVIPPSRPCCWAENSIRYDFCRS